MLDWFVYFLATRPAEYIALYLAGINLLTFVIYRQDKRAAERYGPRVPEATLHCIMFIGGTVGAFLGQRILRHKTRKQSFQLVFWLLFVIQLVFLAYIATLLAR